MINLPAAAEKTFPQEWLVGNDQKRAAGAKTNFPQEWLHVVKMISLELKKLSRKNDWKNDYYVIQNAIIRTP